ncbi:Sucrose phosphorylase [compost metagenome]
MDRVRETGEGREINRHNYTIEEMDLALEKEVVQRLLKLIRFRNAYPAFNGEFRVLESPENEIRLLWSREDKSCLLVVDLNANESVIQYVDEHGRLTDYRI